MILRAFFSFFVSSSTAVLNRVEKNTIFFVDVVAWSLRLRIVWRPFILLPQWLLYCRVWP